VPGPPIGTQIIAAADTECPMPFQPALSRPNACHAIKEYAADTSTVALRTVISHTRTALTTSLLRAGIYFLHRGAAPAGPQAISRLAAGSAAAARSDLT
jgi:hypothetical protein